MKRLFQRVYLTVCLTSVILTSTPVSGTVGQFGQMIEGVTAGTLSLGSINGYGNYCGFLGSGTPLDNIDRCCQSHDQCLKQSNTNSCFPLHYLSFFIVPYTWTSINEVVVCSSGNSRCQRGLCECDGAAATCFATHKSEYNPTYKRRVGLFG